MLQSFGNTFPKIFDFIIILLILKNSTYCSFLVISFNIILNTFKFLYIFIYYFYCLNKCQIINLKKNQ